MHALLGIRDESMLIAEGRRAVKLNARGEEKELQAHRPSFVSLCLTPVVLETFGPPHLPLFNIAPLTKLTGEARPP